MKQDLYHRAAQLYHLLSHPARLRILDELRREEAYMCHLQAVLGRPQAYVSQQLCVLREAGVVTDRKDGQLVYYRLADPQVERLLEGTLEPTGQPSCLPACPCSRCSSGNLGTADPV